jgi:hypothetical protein
MDLPDLKAAREDAIRFCGEMLNHTTRLGELLKKKQEGKPIERPEQPWLRKSIDRPNPRVAACA